MPLRTSLSQEVNSPAGGFTTQYRCPLLTGSYFGRTSNIRKIRNCKKLDELVAAVRRQPAGWRRFAMTLDVDISQNATEFRNSAVSNANLRPFLSAPVLHESWSAIR